MTFPYDLYPPYDPTWPPRRTPFGFEPVGPLPPPEEPPQAQSPSRAAAARRVKAGRFIGPP